MRRILWLKIHFRRMSPLYFGRYFRDNWQPMCKALIISLFPICGFLPCKRTHIAFQKKAFCIVKGGLLQNDVLLSAFLKVGTGYNLGIKTGKRQLHVVMSYKMITFAAQFKTRSGMILPCHISQLLRCEGNGKSFFRRY